jgi:protein-tyrosine phosphatase
VTSWATPKTVTFQAGFRTVAIEAGPYVEFTPRSTFRVNLAREVKIAADLHLHTADYSVPSREAVRAALAKTMLRLQDEDDRVYIGCAFGIGRTGTFLALLMKLGAEMTRIATGERNLEDPVIRVRRVYYPSAVETSDQARLVRTMDMFSLARSQLFRQHPSIAFDKRFWLRHI